MTARELMYVAAQAGAKEFYGLKDPFKGVSEADVQDVLTEVQTGLDRKGYAQMDFQGAFVIQEEMAELVKTCAFCDAYLCVQPVRGTPVKPAVIYFRQGAQVLLTEAGDQQSVVLRECMAEEAQDALKLKAGLMSKAEYTDACDLPFECLSEAMQAMKEGQMQRAKQVITQVCACKTLQELLLDGMLGRVEVALWSMTDLKNQQVHSLFWLGDEKRGAMLTRALSAEPVWTMSTAGEYEVQAQCMGMLAALTQEAD